MALFQVTNRDHLQQLKIPFSRFKVLEGLLAPLQGLASCANSGLKRREPMSILVQGTATP